VLDDLDTPDDLVRFIFRRTVEDHGRSCFTEDALRKVGLLPQPLSADC